MIRRRLILLAAAFALAGAPACSADRETAERDLDRRLDELGSEMDRLRDEAARAGEAAKERLRVLQDGLELRRQEAARRVRAAREASGDSWNRFRDDARSAMDELGDAVKKSWQELKR